LKTGARFALRQTGAGAQQLLEILLYRAGTSVRELDTLAPACPTGSDLAQAIRSGHADCGIATRSAANSAGLDFIPLVWEWFDLALQPRDYFRPPLDQLMRFMRTRAFTERAEELGGYDTASAGTVRFAP
jgi:molybdate-binding protein